MRNKAIFFVILLVLTVALGWSTGCRKNVEVPFPPSLAGNYTGIYTIQVIDGIDTLVDTFQYITFKFTSASYIMLLNEKLMAPDQHFFCDCGGTYELENGVQLEETDENLTKIVCTPDYNPKEAFGLEQNTGTDTILMKRDFIDSVGIRSIKTLKLVLET